MCVSGAAAQAAGAGGASAPCPAPTQGTPLGSGRSLPSLLAVLNKPPARFASCRATKQAQPSVGNGGGGRCGPACICNRVQPTSGASETATGFSSFFFAILRVGVAALRQALAKLRSSNVHLCRVQRGSQLAPKEGGPGEETPLAPACMSMHPWHLNSAPSLLCVARSRHLCTPSCTGSSLGAPPCWPHSVALALPPPAGATASAFG